MERLQGNLSIMFTVLFSHLNGLCLGLDISTKELTMMNKRSGGDKALWKWQGKSLINKMVLF